MTRPVRQADHLARTTDPPAASLAGANATTVPAGEQRPSDRFAQRLRYWRQFRGLSQAALARAVHVHRDLIAKIERTLRWPSYDLVVRCESVLAAGGELTRLWPEVENERARSQLLAAEQRLHERLRRAHDLGVAVPPRQPVNLAPEAAFLGDQSVTIVTPLKTEAINARPVVALEDVVGAQRLGELARRLGSTPTFENVPIGGEIDLNRPNLVVICGPRLSAGVARVLEGDRDLRFVRATDGPWTLHDLNTGEVYRSGQDQQVTRPWDVAYLGRLQRPDGGGSIMIFTGIHPHGSLGVVRLLVERINELHAQAGDRRFSVLIGTDYHPGTGEPLRAEPLTPLYWKDGDSG